jgi:hypothetical protein
MNIYDVDIIIVIIGAGDFLALVKLLALLRLAFVRKSQLRLLTF